MFSRSRLTLTFAALLLAAGSCRPQSSNVYSLSGDIAFTHDPSIAKDGATWYVFATGRTPQGGQLAVRCSHDLEHWKLCGQVFDTIPAWIVKRSPGTKDLWAPDVSYEDHEYRLYYAYSLFGKNTSGIALAVNRTLDPSSPEYKWVDKGLVLESNVGDNFNAIDPNFVRDRHGHDWLAFGSFWDGIKMRRLDDKTGLLSAKDTKVYSLARRAKPADATPPRPGLPPDWEAIEAPFIVFHGGYYYLFTSWDLCCRGVKSTYKTMVGRSKSVIGPYLDQAGRPLLEGGGTPLLVGNHRWLGPGGESVLMGPKEDLIVFHAYDAKTGRPSMQLSTIDWTGGWPHAGLEP